MIIFLYGKDNFRSLGKLKKIIARYKDIHKTGLNLKFFDFQKDRALTKPSRTSFEDFKTEFQTKSMFEEKKLFVLKSVFSNPQFKEKFLKQKKEFLKSRNTILFYESCDLRENDSFFIFLKENSTVQKFDLLEGRKLESWIKIELAKQKAEIEPEARMLLIKYVDNDLWQLSNEINKLVNYKWNPEKIKITKEDVKALTPQKIDLDIFKTIDFMAERQKQKAISSIHKHLEKGDSPLYLLSMINFQFRNLLMLKEICQSGENIKAKIKKLNLHPFVVKKSLGLCQKFTLEELKKIYQKIFQIDLAIKTGNIDPSLGLDLLIAQI